MNLECSLLSMKMGFCGKVKNSYWTLGMTNQRCCRCIALCITLWNVVMKRAALWMWLSLYNLEEFHKQSSTLIITWPSFQDAIFNSVFPYHSTYWIDFCSWAGQRQRNQSQEVQQVPRLSFSEIGAKLLCLLAPEISLLGQRSCTKEKSRC